MVTMHSVPESPVLALTSFLGPNTQTLASPTGQGSDHLPRPGHCVLSSSPTSCLDYILHISIPCHFLAHSLPQLSPSGAEIHTPRCS